MCLFTPNLLAMSDLALEIQEHKNQESAQNEPVIPAWEQVEEFTKQADEMNLYKMIQDNIMKNRDANDKDEDNIYPADPQEQICCNSSNY